MSWVIGQGDSVNDLPFFYLSCKKATNRSQNLPYFVRKICNKILVSFYSLKTSHYLMKATHLQKDSFVPYAFIHFLLQMSCRYIFKCMQLSRLVISISLQLIYRDISKFQMSFCSSLQMFYNLAIIVAEKPLTPNIPSIYFFFMNYFCFFR